jgi:hypothetical protein
MLIARRQIAELIMGAMLTMLMTAVLASSANSAEGPEYTFEKAFGAGFSVAGPIAVDQAAGNVYVLDRVGNALYKFDLEGNPVDFGGASANILGNKLFGLSIGGQQGERQVAVDSTTHTIYLTGKNIGASAEGLGGIATALQAFKSNGEPSLFTAGPRVEENEIVGFKHLRGVAVDVSGNIYVANDDPETGQPDQVEVFTRQGAGLVSNIHVADPANIAVNGSGVLYAVDNTGLRALLPSESPVTSSTTYTTSPGKVDNNSVRSMVVDPVTNRLFALEVNTVNGIGRVAIFDKDGVLEKTFVEPGELQYPEGIAIGGDGERVFISHNPEGGVPQVKLFKQQFCEVCKPQVNAVSATSVSGDSATLRASINPEGKDTTYWFEYGTEDCATSVCAKLPVDGASTGGGRKEIVVTQSITGLTPNTQYFYRVLAKNENGFANEVATNLETKSFTTQGSGLGFSLSDSRAWEMVSPSKKFGGIVMRSGHMLSQASLFGDKIVYPTRGSVVENPDSNLNPQPATVLAERNANGRWSAADLTPARVGGSSTLVGATEYKIFTPNLLEAELEPNDADPLSSQASEPKPYLWRDGIPPSFEALVSPSSLPAGVEVPEDAQVTIEGASPDLSHVVIRSEVTPLVAGAEVPSIYLWSDGELEPVSELPEGGPVIRGMLGSGPGSVRHAVSDDGARVFWAKGIVYNTERIELEALFLRDTVAEESVRLDIPESGASGSGAERPVFNIASADGGVVFFTDTQRLTADASPSGRDLYRCEIGAVAGGLGCVELTDISAPLPGTGESAEVVNQVSGASEDGTRLYFVARGALDEAPNERDESAKAGEPNLYYWQDGQAVKFIARLSDSDGRVWGDAEGVGYTVSLSASASPSGRFFTFTSDSSLTGYENKNASDESNAEVFVYDSGAGGDKLACVSCNPTGAAAVGEKLPDEIPSSFAPDSAGLWKGKSVAGILPQGSETRSSGRALYRPRIVLDSGRVFFNAVDPLVPADSNGNWDVYQYEPVGVGSCTATTNTAAVSRVGNGCVGLLSSGSSPGDSGFLDATPSGDDVFFLTPGRLSALDIDDEMDVYDARVNGITAVIPPKQECVGEACQPVIGPPNDPTPASESFRGPEPSVNCRKGQRKVKRNGTTKCAKKKHKKKHGKGKKASKSGGAGR